MIWISSYHKTSHNNWTILNQNQFKCNSKQAISHRRFFHRRLRVSNESQKSSDNIDQLNLSPFRESASSVNKHIFAHINDDDDGETTHIVAGRCCQFHLPTDKPPWVDIDILWKAVWGDHQSNHDFSFLRMLPLVGINSWKFDCTSIESHRLAYNVTQKIVVKGEFTVELIIIISLREPEITHRRCETNIMLWMDQYLEVIIGNIHNTNQIVNCNICVSPAVESNRQFKFLRLPNTGLSTAAESDKSVTNSSHVYLLSIRSRLRIYNSVCTRLSTAAIVHQLTVILSVQIDCGNFKINANRKHPNCYHQPIEGSYLSELSSIFCLSGRFFHAVGVQSRKRACARWRQWWRALLKITTFDADWFV